MTELPHDSPTPSSADEIPESGLCVVLPGWAPEPDVDALAEQLTALGRAPRQEPPAGAEPWRLAWDGGNLTLVDLEVPDGSLEFFARDLGPNGRAALLDAHLAIRLGCRLEAGALLDSYHEALRLLDRLVDGGVAFFDSGPGTWRPRSWLARAARSVAPPAPTSLFTIHAVVDRTDPEVWLHTHGLRRCGAVELEILDVPRDATGLFGHLLNATAAIVMEHGLPEPSEPIEVGRGMSVAWMPWYDALQHLPQHGLGRLDRDLEHDAGHGVLLVPGRRRSSSSEPTWRSPLALQPILEGEPIFWVTRSETLRMALLASERFPDFRNLVRRFGGQDGFGFLVKLGYTMDADDDAAEAETEHLWFEVHAVDGARVDATLINEPAGIARFSEGDRAWHEIDQLSDWLVHSPYGAFDPGSIDALFERFESD